MAVAFRRKGHPQGDTYPRLVSIDDYESDIARRAHRRRAEREALLRASLNPGEAVLAHHAAVMVTDRRVLFAWNVQPFGWHSDAISFEEIRSWALGQRHDERPLLRIAHPTHVRMQRVPAHRFLRFAWGNASAEVPHDDVTLTFTSKRDPSFRALFERVLHLDVPRGDDFVVALPRTREERKGSVSITRVTPDR
jgi:hypothetical protein